MIYIRTAREPAHNSDSGPLPGSWTPLV